MHVHVPKIERVVTWHELPEDVGEAHCARVRRFPRLYQ